MICLMLWLLLLCATTAQAENDNIEVAQDGLFQLLVLPYDYDALEPAIGRKTMQLHHSKHLKGYVDKLNRLIIGTRYASMPLSRIVVLSDSTVYDQSVFNNAGQVLNHNLYFTQLSPDGGGEPQGILADAIVNKWGSFNAFKQAFNNSSAELFGAGWVWLVCDHEGELYIVQEPNGGNPVTRGLEPLLGVDVWEHAYYLDYQNRRSDYVDALWDIVDWSVVEERYEATGVIENNCQSAIEMLSEM